MQNDEFTELIWQRGQELYRDMPWRRDTRPYYVLVSELMLQQTQVARVIPKFESFITSFPNEQALADAELADVLRLWQGLGYNRRAKFLHASARMITQDFGGKFPSDQTDVLRLPGVGKNTAGAIGAYAFNQPAIFVETNVRTVYLHHFFSDDSDVSDVDIAAQLSATIDREHPREFYWALMDYGSWLKQNGVRNISQSRHYKKQSPLEGSVRQVRGQIISALSASELSEPELRGMLRADERFEPALEGLLKDGLITVSMGRVRLTK